MKNEHKIKQQLAELKKQIKNECGEKNTWFFCENDDVNTISHMKEKGWLGTESIFIFPNPSWKNIKNGELENKKLIKFYDLLKEFNLTNAHLTDLIKIRTRGSSFARGTESYDALIGFKNFILNNKRAQNKIKINYANQLKYLLKEFEIINANNLSKIVIMGGGIFDQIVRLFIEKYLPQYQNHQNLIMNTYHYSYVFRFGKLDKFKKQLQNISNKLKKI